MTHPLKIALLCGGPSQERGISLNSARSVCDHLDSPDIELLPIYFDQSKNAHQISRSQLYSNTPSDFDFKLAHLAKPLSEAELVARLKSVDIVFPAIHGKFGEDGELQAFLEKHSIPFIASPSGGCRIAFDKYEASEFIRKRGFYTIPCLLLTKDQSGHAEELQKFFAEHNIKRAVVKPARAGSSIAVFSVGSAQEALVPVNKIFGDDIDDRLVVEPFCEGREFTVIILENARDEPVALFPMEVEMDYTNHQIFDYRRKYLATRQVSYHCPARFPDSVLATIRSQAQELFKAFGLRDFARFDGWLLDNGKIYFPDFNTISGMEQNSFLFIQGALLGFSHRDILRYIVEHACKRYDIAFQADAENSKVAGDRERVNVLFGGDTAERHVSVMSGTNVWLKLRRSQRYAPRPYLLDMQRNVWELPYALALYHTVEEITELCRTSSEREQRIVPLRQAVRESLGASQILYSEDKFLPRKLTLDQFTSESKIVFIAVHGGIGENGTLQGMFEQSGVSYTGSDRAASQLCMDKFQTGAKLAGLESEGISVAKKQVLVVSELAQKSNAERQQIFAELVTQLGSESLIVKPLDDGCSAGVARLYNGRDFATYVDFTCQGAKRIPSETLTAQANIVELSSQTPQRLLFETFVSTAALRVRGNQLLWPTGAPDWVEITVGVLGKKGNMHALNPSITVASSDILSLEEKFQGGTGINITPPPAEFVSAAVVQRAKNSIERVANILGINGFSRIDAFLNVKSGEIIVIEANTIPGLTPSTVIYQQALTEEPPLTPREFLEGILGLRS